MSNLTTEELLAILEQRKNVSQKNATQPLIPVSSGKCCLYVPIKPKGAPQCITTSETPYGYCKKHSTTVQAKKAREQYEAETFLEEVENPKVEKSVSPKVEKPKVEKVELEVVKEEPTPQVTAPVEPKVYVQAEKPAAFTTPQYTFPKPIPTQKVAPTKAIRKKVIRPNFWGRYEDPDTRILFDPKTKSAYGIQESTGKVSALKPEHIDICKRNLWNYHSVEESSEESEIEEESSEESDSDDSSNEDSSNESEEDSEEEEEDSDEEEEESDEDEEEESEIDESSD